MTLTLQCKLYLTVYQAQILSDHSVRYINAVNAYTHTDYPEDEWKKFTSRHISAVLPSNIKDSIKQDLKSILTIHKKKQRKNPEVKLPVLKKPIIKWSYVGYGVKSIDTLSIQCWDKKAFRMLVKMDMLPENYELIQKSKIGSLRITQKNNKWVAQIAVTIPDNPLVNSNDIMGVDIGIKVPAVCFTSNQKVKFCGNGRMNKYYRRKAMGAKRKLGKAKKLNGLRKLKDKEKRWMTYQDHCISKQVVDFAIKNNISVIKMEQLSGIRKSTSKSRKNTGYIHRWSFYRIQQFIEYKAKRCGITVEYVNPKFTSQICPCCGEKNKAEDRLYSCKICGYCTHRDLVGAMNIMRVSAADGNSQSA